MKISVLASVRKSIEFSDAIEAKTAQGKIDRLVLVRYAKIDFLLSIYLNV